MCCLGEWTLEDLSWLKINQRYFRLKCFVCLSNNMHELLSCRFCDLRLYVSVVFSLSCQLSLFTGHLSMQSSQWTQRTFNELSMNNAHINCHCSLDVSQCKTLNELSMGNAHINLSMGNSQGRDMGLNCLTMEIVSTLNGHPLSGMEGWQKKPLKMWSFAKSPFTTHP